MSTIKHISLLQFRNYPVADFSFNAPISCITGANGSGKTNLLDAVYYLCYTKSYFSASQQSNVRNGFDGFRLNGFFEKNGTTEEISCKWQQGKKEVYANGVLYDKLTEHIGKYAAVMIAPDDIELVNGSSELRRKWIDSILGQVSREYLDGLLLYQRILLQRNAWLKMQNFNPSPDRVELEHYNAQLAKSGTYIFECRRQFMHDFLPLLQDYYKRLCNGVEDINVVYETDLLEKPLTNLLANSFQQDLRLQRTSKGIHKDDLDFLLNNNTLKNYASQGQKKSFLFALKLAQYAYLHTRSGHTPILLLDDIFEKLDQQRIEALLNIICSKNFAQVLITDTHLERVKASFAPIHTVQSIVLS